MPPNDGREREGRRGQPVVCQRALRMKLLFPLPTGCPLGECERPSEPERELDKPHTTAARAIGERGSGDNGRAAAASAGLARPLAHQEIGRFYIGERGRGEEEERTAVTAVLGRSGRALARPKRRQSGGCKKQEAAVDGASAERERREEGLGGGRGGGKEVRRGGK